MGDFNVASTLLTSKLSFDALGTTERSKMSHVKISLEKEPLDTFPAPKNNMYSAMSKSAVH